MNSIELYLDKESARFYDIEHGASPTDEDVKYYLEKCSDTKGPILELACGTGRLLLPALENGCNVEGLDLSDTMMDVLEKKLKEKGLETALHRADMSEFSLGSQYDMVFIAVSSFLLLPTQEKQLGCLRSCHSHLNKGGRLILDILVERCPTDEAFRFFRRIEVDGKQLLIQLASIRNNLHRCEELIYRYEVYADTGQLERTFIRTMPWRSVSPDEFTLMANQAGFENVEIFGGYTTDSPSSQHQEIVAILTK